MNTYYTHMYTDFQLKYWNTGKAIDIYIFWNPDSGKATH